ncbi:MAG TPA: ABC transporter substrate-binding protein [Thermoplasmata archaeon]
MRGGGAEVLPHLEEAVAIRSHRVALVSALVVFVMVLQLATFAPLTMNARAQGPSTLTVGFLANIESLNPFRGINDADYFFYGLVYDYLFALDEDGNPLPDIAVDAVQDESGFNWTYTIRQGVKWHDGTDLTAQDVAFTINYQIPSGGTFFHLWAYEPYVNRIVRCATGQTTNCGAQVTGANEVTVYFDLPFVPGKALYVPIIKQSQWESVSQQSAQASYNNLMPIGTGPFMADPSIGDQWLNDEPLVLHKNPNYHLYVPFIDEVVLRSGLTDVSLVQSLQTGDIDVAQVEPGGYEVLAGAPGVGRQEYLLSTQYWIEFSFQQLNEGQANSKLNPARWDQNVRRAMAMATNKDLIIDTDFLGKGVRGTSLMSPITPSWHYDPADPSIEPDPTVNLTYDADVANALLDAAGYTAECAGKPGVRAAASAIDVDANGAPGVVSAGTCLSFKLGVRQEYPTEQAAARDLVTMFQQIGVEITDTNGNPGTFSIMLESALSDAVYYSNSIDTYIWYWSGDPDPNYLLSIESGFTLDGWNDNYWNNATYNQLYVDHLAARDPLERQEIARAAQKLHYESAVYIILIYPMGQWAYREGEFTGWGDWAAHPYRQLNAFWTAPPLFRELRPTAAAPAPEVTVADSSGRTGEPVTITGTITDELAGTWTLDFGDNSADATGSYDPGTRPVSEVHTYADEGVYTVRLTADNGQASRTAIGEAQIAAVANLRPDQVALVPDRTSGLPGTMVNFTMSAHDAEGGTLTFTIDFDDGNTDTEVVADVAPDSVTTVNFSHTYTESGSYIAAANVSDGTLVSSEARVTITIQAPTVAPSGVDARVIGGIVVILIAVVAGVALVLRRRARQKDETLPPPPPKQ